VNGLQLATQSHSQSLSQSNLVFIAMIVVVIAIAVAVERRLLTLSRAVTKGSGLPKGHYARVLTTLFIDPAVEIWLVGAILWADLIRNGEHVVAGVFGAAVGLSFGYLRYRIQYVGAVPEHRAVVLVRSRAEYVAVAALLAVRLAAEQDEIPLTGALTLLVTLLLSACVFESIGRTACILTRYRRDVAAGEVVSDSAEATQRGGPKIAA